MASRASSGVWLCPSDLDFCGYYVGGLFFGAVAVLSVSAMAVQAFIREQPWYRLVPLPASLQLVVLALVLWAVSFDGAFHLRFATSRRALEAAAEDPFVRAGRIGHFDVRAMDRPRNAVRFVLNDTWYQHGLAYSPAGDPPRVSLGSPCDEYTHLEGPWWVWTQHP